MIHFSRRTSMAAKGAAVILMLIHHLFSCNTELAARYGVTYAPFSEGQVMAFSAMAKICVGIFVFLSTYGMTVSLANYKGRMSGYLKHRMTKLMVSFWIVYALSAATFFFRPEHLGVYAGDGKFRGLIYILADISGLSHMFGTPTYNETWWYMTLAILLVFLTPVLIRFYEKFRICAVAVIALLPALGLPQSGLTTYLFTAMLGIWAAKSGCFGILREKLSSGGRKAGFLLLNILVLVFLCYLRMQIGLVYWADALIAFSLAAELFVLMDLLPMRFPVLSFIGNCSMNIFLIHTLIFEYYFPAFIYSPKNWILITLLLLAVSAAVSFVIKLLQDAVLKKLLRRREA